MSIYEAICIPLFVVLLKSHDVRIGLLLEVGLHEPRATSLNHVSIQWVSIYYSLTGRLCCPSTFIIS